MNIVLETYIYRSGQRLEIVQGDLTQESVDAIVNAANERLAHGGGVAGVIVRKGGNVIQEESTAWVKAHGPVSHARPAYTGAGKLSCRYVIHAVGPVWGAGDEDRKLADAIYGSLAVADELSLTSMALPAVSTGIFGFPKDRAAHIFYETFERYFHDHPGSRLNRVRLTLYDAATLQPFLAEFRAWKGALEDG